MAPFDGSQTEVRARTIQTVIDLVAADPTLVPARRRELISALNRFCALLALDPRTTEASFNANRARMRRFEPASADLRAKTWSNIRSAVRFAFEHSGVRYRAHRPPRSHAGVAGSARPAHRSAPGARAVPADPLQQWPRHRAGYGVGPGRGPLL
jgi:hypothetical protein